MIVHAAVYRFPLERLVPYSLLQLHAGYLLREIHLAAVAALYHLGELLGYAALRTVVLRKKYILVVVFVAAGYISALLRHHQTVPELLFVYLKLVGHAVGEVVLRYAGVPVVGVLAQAPEYPG